MTKTYTQDEAVRDILRITLDSSIRPLSQTHGDQVREILDQLIATTRRETVEEYLSPLLVKLQRENHSDDVLWFVQNEIEEIIVKLLDQLPDKQEV